MREGQRCEYRIQPGLDPTTDQDKLNAFGLEVAKLKRIATRIALETALVYEPSTGFVESVVKGGGKNHGVVLELFGKHIVGQPLDPEEVEKPKYRLNVLRDGMMEPFDEWYRGYGICGAPPLLPE